MKNKVITELLIMGAHIFMELSSMDFNRSIRLKEICRQLVIRMRFPHGLPPFREKGSGMT